MTSFDEWKPGRRVRIEEAAIELRAWGAPIRPGQEGEIVRATISCSVVLRLVVKLDDDGREVALELTTGSEETFATEFGRAWARSTASVVLLPPAQQVLFRLIPRRTLQDRAVLGQMLLLISGGYGPDLG